ncbi:hypothetical protein [Undibacterium sp. RuTC16W]|uniref:hypothetical protein n=1 Tax=Undibacterium sp. RuTC16W TaxID=3413048 RepID=UPI003BF0D15E
MIYALADAVVAEEDAVTVAFGLIAFTVNKAACAFANKLASICYATLRDGEDYRSIQRLNKKIEKISYGMPT